MGVAARQADQHRQRLPLAQAAGQVYLDRDAAVLQPGRPPDQRPQQRGLGRVQGEDGHGRAVRVGALELPGGGAEVRVGDQDG